MQSAERRLGPAADCGMDRRQETAGRAEKPRRGAAQWPRRAGPGRKVLRVLGYERGKIWRGFCFPSWTFNNVVTEIIRCERI